VESYSVDINPNQIPNLVFKHHRPHKMKLSVIIDKPVRELEILKKIDALDKKENNISAVDLSKDNFEKADELINSLQGLANYTNDKCPMMGKKNMNFDLSNALKSLKQSTPQTLSSAKVMFSESFIGSKTMESHPPHHVLNDGYILFPQTPSFPPDNVEMPPALPKLNNEGDQTINLFAEKDNSSRRLLEKTKSGEEIYSAESLLTEEISNPKAELDKLNKIASLDGDPNMISNLDVQKAKKLGLLKDLEGFELYTNDAGEDATIYDLNMSFGILSLASTNIDLSETKAIAEELLIADNQRHTIRKMYFLNKKSGHYIPISILKLDNH